MKRSLLAVLFLAVGCSTGALKHTVDDSVIEGIPAHERPAVVEARRAVAASVQAKTGASAEIAAAEKAIEDAKLGRKGAEQQLDAAEIGKKAADTAVDLAEKRLAWAKQTQATLSSQVTVAATEYELSKAKLINDRGIKPTKDFALVDFETDAMSAKKDAAQSQLDASKMRTEMDELQKKYLDLTARYQQAKNSNR